MRRLLRDTLTPQDRRHLQAVSDHAGDRDDAAAALGVEVSNINTAMAKAARRMDMKNDEKCLLTRLRDLAVID